MRRTNRFPLFALLSLWLAVPAFADHHFMRIAQIYGGDETHPDAQYVVLQMCIAGQNILAGHTVHYFDAAGVEIGSGPAFPSNVASGASQRKVLIATSTAEAVFGVTADLRVPARILPAGGKFCFETAAPIDCIAWGSYAPADATVGTPYSAALGIVPGTAAQRDLTIAGSPTEMDCLGSFDDTNDSAADFDEVSPTPENNAQVDGVLDPDHIFLHGFEAGATAGWSSTTP